MTDTLDPAIERLEVMEKNLEADLQAVRCSLSVLRRERNRGAGAGDPTTLQVLELLSAEIIGSRTVKTSQIIAELNEKAPTSTGWNSVAFNNFRRRAGFGELFMSPLRGYWRKKKPDEPDV